MTESNLDRVYEGLKRANHKSKRSGGWSSVAEVDAETKNGQNVGTALEILVKEKRAVKKEKQLLYKIHSGLAFGASGSSNSKRGGRDQDDRRSGRGDRSDRNRDLATGAVVGAVAVGGLGRIASVIR
jgi:hypothetical protein